ncbi:hypothetical protein JB92DRAFT_3109423 [Gautieria morchelliformis]|nr:hypothetical protein JB92DRAFT_3109423 [Gautieria morchelliformis]
MSYASAPCTPRVRPNFRPADDRALDLVAPMPERAMASLRADMPAHPTTPSPTPRHTRPRTDTPLEPHSPPNVLSLLSPARSRLPPPDSGPWIAFLPTLISPQMPARPTTPSPTSRHTRPRTDTPLEPHSPPNVPSLLSPARSRLPPPDSGPW